MFNLVNQTKLIWTALFVYLVLAKPQSNMQMLALLMLMVSAVLLTAAPSDQGSSVPTSLWSGIVPNLVAAVLSGLAAALSQYATQSPKLGRCVKTLHTIELMELIRSGYVFTMELCVFQVNELIVA